jgi:hypothetical protein
MSGKVSRGVADDSHGRGQARWLRATRNANGLVWALLAFTGITLAQVERKPKVPGLDKVIGGASRGAFSGKVQSVDLKDKVLNVVSAGGQNTEIFPITKKVQVASADGERLNLKSLAPGTNVLVYYSQRGDRRQVKQIVVLVASPPSEKVHPKSSPHS